jgi:hypothetical protein
LSNGHLLDRLRLLLTRHDGAPIHLGAP